MLLLLLAAPVPARAEKDAGGRDRGRAHSGRVEEERDDPRGRSEARHVVEGERSADTMLSYLRLAEAEARRWGVENTPRSPAAGAARNAALAPTGAWIILGPDNDLQTDNGGAILHKVDSGRVRRIVVDPTNDDVVYVAVAGGGVWKTYDATTPVTPASGPRWTPISEAIGSLAIGSIAINPQNPQLLLLGLGDPFDVKASGLLHTSDGGQHWGSAVTLSGVYTGSRASVTSGSVRDIAYDPGGSGVVLAATDAGLFKARAPARRCRTASTCTQTGTLCSSTTTQARASRCSSAAPTAASSAAAMC